MIKKFIHLLAIPSILFMGSCASTKTAQLNDQNDDVYYSIAKAREVDPVVIAKQEEKRSSDYVTEDELYGDSYGDYGYYNDYTSRFNRFRTYAPSLGYYNSLYGYNYDPYFSNSYFPNSYFGGSSFNIGIGLGFGAYNYNPWRNYGYNYGYGSNFWGPYSFYNSFNSYGYGNGNGYYGGNYSGIYSSPAFNSPNYRPRPSRSTDNLTIDRGSVISGPGGVIYKDPNGNIISRGRAERYGDQVQPNATSGTRTQPAVRPDRANQSPPQRAAQPERIYTAPPRQDTGSGSRSNPAPSNNNGGGSSSSRPSRGN
ncbi:hypothetical protein [Daejeonella rubra]|nr:hypothetical protein [Daejeonella rubra]